MTLREAAELAGVRLARRREPAGLLPSSDTWTPRPPPGWAPTPPGVRRAVRRRGLPPDGDRGLAELAHAQTRAPAAQGGVGRLEAGPRGPGEDLEQEQVRAPRRFARQAAPPLDPGFLRISRSSCEYHARAGASTGDPALRRSCREAFEAGRGRSGLPARHASCAAAGPVELREAPLRRVMREFGPARSPWPSPASASSYAAEEALRSAPQRRSRGHVGLPDFAAARPGGCWSPHDRVLAPRRRPQAVYLSPALDLYDGDVAAFSCDTSPSKALVAEMREGASRERAAGSRCTRPRRRYRTPDWVARCEAAGAQATSRKGPQGPRRVRGLLRQAQGRVLPRPRLARLDRGVVHRGAVRLRPLVPRGAPQGLRRGRRDGVRHDQGPQGAARADRLGRSKKMSAPPLPDKAGVS